MNPQPTSTLMLTNVTTIDFAYLNAWGRLYGASINPIIQVTGALNGEEAVVCDFGTVKKRIKALIDDPELGYDHKLVLPRDAFLTGRVQEFNQPRVVVDSEFFHMGAPNNAVRVLEHTSHYTHSGFAHELKSFLKQHMPEFDFDITTDDTPNCLPFGTLTKFGAATSHARFNYTHGLPRSTSWGCVNAAHGHGSFIQLLMGDDPCPFVHYINEGASALIRAIDDTYFVNSDYAAVINGGDPAVIGVPCTRDISVNYEHAERGPFSLALINQQVCFVDCETTVENLAAVIANLPEAKALCKLGVTGLYISEGQWKGCVVPLIADEVQS
jgi:6-pyruvoyl-tetrahydropterin synthase